MLIPISSVTIFDLSPGYGWSDLDPVCSCVVLLPRFSRFMAQFALALVPLIATILIWVPPVLAGAPLLCQTIEGHEVCLVSIKRSAKNFWEYRVQLRVDGRVRAKERYDCRRTLRPLPQPPQPSPQALHELVCSLTQR